MPSKLCVRTYERTQQNTKKTACDYFSNTVSPVKITEASTAIDALFTKNIRKRDSSPDNSNVIKKKRGRPRKNKISEMSKLRHELLNCDSLNVKVNTTFDNLLQGPVYNEVNICNKSSLYKNNSTDTSNSNVTSDKVQSPYNVRKTKKKNYATLHSHGIHNDKSVLPSGKIRKRKPNPKKIKQSVKNAVINISDTTIDHPNISKKLHSYLDKSVNYSLVIDKQLKPTYTPGLRCARKFTPIASNSRLMSLPDSKKRDSTLGRKGFRHHLMMRAINDPKYIHSSTPILSSYKKIDDKLNVSPITASAKKRLNFTANNSKSLFENKKLNDISSIQNSVNNSVNKNSVSNVILINSTVSEIVPNNISNVREKITIDNFEENNINFKSFIANDVKLNGKAVVMLEKHLNESNGNNIQLTEPKRTDLENKVVPAVLIERLSLPKYLKNRELFVNTRPRSSSKDSPISSRSQSLINELSCIEPSKIKRKRTKKKSVSRISIQRCNSTEFDKVNDCEEIISDEDSARRKLKRRSISSTSIKKSVSESRISDNSEDFSNNIIEDSNVISHIPKRNRRLRYSSGNFSQNSKRISDSRNSVNSEDLSLKNKDLNTIKSKSNTSTRLRSNSDPRISAKSQNLLKKNSNKTKSTSSISTELRSSMNLSDNDQDTSSKRNSNSLISINSEDLSYINNNSNIITLKPKQSTRLRYSSGNVSDNGINQNSKRISDSRISVNSEDLSMKNKDSNTVKSKSNISTRLRSDSGSRISANSQNLLKKNSKRIKSTSSTELRSSMNLSDNDQDTSSKRNSNSLISINSEDLSLYNNDSNIIKFKPKQSIRLRYSSGNFSDNDIEYGSSKRISKPRISINSKSIINKDSIKSKSNMGLRSSGNFSDNDQNTNKYRNSNSRISTRRSTHNLELEKFSRNSDIVENSIVLPIPKRFITTRKKKVQINIEPTNNHELKESTKPSNISFETWDRFSQCKVSLVRIEDCKELNKYSKLFKINDNCVSEKITHANIVHDNANRKSIYLKPGKKWFRSLSILRRTNLHEIEDDIHFNKGRKWHDSIVEVLDNQNDGAFNKIGNESVVNDMKHTKRSTRAVLGIRKSLKIVNISIKDLSDLAIETVSFQNKSGYVSTLAHVSVLESFDKLSLSTNADEREETARQIILKRCGQTDPIPFDDCYSARTLKKCRKIGEGVYGEVFMYKSVDNKCRVMKVIPIEGNQAVNGEHQKKFEEIISEIIIASELSNLRINNEFCTNGFAELQQIFCVQGKYPQHLLDLWDLFDEERGSENDSPEIFTEDQLYIVLELENGGQDLEAYRFNNAEQSYALFVQVVCSLAVAESALQFEHRDMHWGNILISPTDETTTTFRLKGREFEVATKGVKVSIIDFTLSRMTYNNCCIFNDLALDPDLFTATGDYQFDIYRLMKQRNLNDWQTFEPYTNILWLDYTLEKMISHVRYLRETTKTHKTCLRRLSQIRKKILNYNSATELLNSDVFSHVFL